MAQERCKALKKHREELEKQRRLEKLQELERQRKLVQQRELERQREVERLQKLKWEREQAEQHQRQQMIIQLQAGKYILLRDYYIIP